MLNLSDPPAPLPPAPNPYTPVDNPAGKWNFGESAEAADQGGFTSWPNPNPLLGIHVHRYDPPGPDLPGWTREISTDGNYYWRLRGYLRPQALPTTPPSPSDPTEMSDGTRVLDAAFEVLTPDIHNPNCRTVIVLQSPATFGGDIDSPDSGNAPDFGLRHGYGGCDVSTRSTHPASYVDSTSVPPGRPFSRPRRVLPPTSTAAA